MLCERCKKKKTALFYNENINGRIRSFNLCADCASAMQQSGELEDLSAPLSAFISPLVQTAPEYAAFDLFAAQPPDPSASGSCPLCGITWADLTRENRMGCPVCYTAFFPQGSASASTCMPSSRPYCGKVPRSHRHKQELAARIAVLRQQLALAVSEQRFESAATLRDQIRDMEQKL